MAAFAAIVVTCSIFLGLCKEIEETFILNSASNCLQMQIWGKPEIVNKANIYLKNLTYSLYMKVAKLEIMDKFRYIYNTLMGLNWNEQKINRQIGRKKFFNVLRRLYFPKSRTAFSRFEFHSPAIPKTKCFEIYTSI